MNYYGTYYTHAPSTELYHYGVAGMKWGVRKANDTSTGTKGGKSSKSSDDKAAKKAKTVKAIKIGAAVAGTALAAYGAYKLSQYAKTKSAEIGEAKTTEAVRKSYTRYVEAGDIWGRQYKSTLATMHRIDNHEHLSGYDMKAYNNARTSMQTAKSIMDTEASNLRSIPSSNAKQYGTASHPVSTAKAVGNIIKDYKSRR